MLLDEWNLSSGGFDLRHDTHEGAAFAAGVLAELQENGLDASSFFRATDTRTTGGDHGLVRVDGQRKPAWWTFRLWQDLAERRVAVSGTEEGLWAVASVDQHRMTLLVASFSASRPAARTLEVEVTGLGWTPSRATVRRIDADHRSGAQPEAVAVDGNHLTLPVPAQAVALVELHREVSTDAPPAVVAAERDGTGRLPATGGTGAGPGLVLLGTVLALRRGYARARARRCPTRNHQG